jgi:hypothetical protein
MDSGIQLNNKVGNILINVYEPDMSNAKDAVELLKMLSDACLDTFGTQSTQSNIARAVSNLNANSGDKRDYGFCKKCGAPKKWIQFKEPRESKFQPGLMQEGFVGCSANCGKS